MPTPDQTRIHAERLHPHIVQLWRALVPLKTIVSFMNTGAHPDDETSSMLAAMAFRDGIDISYACSTRGEGGQNDIGRAAHAALGVLRTAEMEQAANVLNMRMYWLSETPEDSIFDFGFSKSGVETLAKWGRARTLKRFVDILRMERPDIICPTFLDIPGQHGHHRAMTEAAHLVMDLAADPAYADSDLPVWQVKKLYLPAWSGAGQAYDDDLPPPPATLTIDASGVEPVTGWSYARIGQQSRAFHATQAMGRWVSPGEEQDWPLHLADTRVAGPDAALSSGLPSNLRDMGMAEVQDAMDAAIAAFPDSAAVLRHACDALALLRAALPGAPSDVAHKLTRKHTQLSHVIRLAARVDVQGGVATTRLRPGDTTGLMIEVRQGDAEHVEVTPVLPAGWTYDAGRISIAENAQISDPYPPVYLPGVPDAPCLSVDVTAHGVTASSRVALERPPIVMPRRSAALTPVADVINIQAANRQIDVSVSDIGPGGANPALTLPDDWRATASDAGFSVRVPDAVKPGLYQLGLTLDGTPADTMQVIDYPHIAPRNLAQPAQISVRIVDVALPDARVGYIGGGNDRVDHWLARLGVDIVALSDADLNSDAALAKFDTLVVGIFAMKFRAGLLAAMPRLHDWVRNGGTLVTLYHRPWDSWDPDIVPPKRLEIGQPSLRWRVTDEAAKVTMLDPAHPLLTTPNKIGPADWDDWHKERGLYFAKDWDAAYTPLLSMHDPDEAALKGALLVADIGKGRHVHTALILHHQMEKLTPGAFRIMANLIAPRG